MNTVHLTMQSNNAKVGRIPVSTSSDDTCPDSCPLRGTDCYARFGPLKMHWDRVSDGRRGGNWGLFCRAVSRFAVGQVWRHNQAGDLPRRRDGKINRAKSLQLARAARHTRGWTYTHHSPADAHNRETVARMNDIGGLVVNLSADNLEQADRYADLAIAPVVVTLPSDAPRNGIRTPKGRVVSPCPAQTVDDITCEKCQLCAIRDRKSIVGFYAHGTASKRLSARISADS